MSNGEQFKKNAGDAAQQAKEKAGQVAHDNRDKIKGALGKLASAIDNKTSGKYHDKLTKAQDAALKGTDKLAEQRPGGAPGPVGDGEQHLPPSGQHPSSDG